MRRLGQVIGIKPEQIDAYERLHTNVWPGVLEILSAHHVHNYTIFRYNTLLFAYFEYDGDDYVADMAGVADDPITREWWTHTEPMQTPVAERVEGEWWHGLAEVFHTD
jgi:L-rhamnose mutarotase